MMKFLSPSHKAVRFESVHWRESSVSPGVRYAIRQPSLSQRIELTRRVHELTQRHEFLQAGKQHEKVEAAFADLLVEKLYVEWGLAAIEGLRIDGVVATPAALVDCGPEELTAEISRAIQQACGLTEQERKNC